MKAYKTLIFGALFLASSSLIFSCNKGDINTAESAEVTPVTLEDLVQTNAEVSVPDRLMLKGTKDYYEAPPKDPIQSRLKIIKEGSLSIESKDIKKSKQALNALLKSVNGYYEQESSNNLNDRITYNLVLRIPSNSFDKFISGVENGEDKITEKTISSEDVSVQYYDVESRLKSKRVYLEKYQNMVSSAKSVKDLLEIQEQIRQLQEEIDASEGTLRNLSGKVEYSSLTINLFEYQANSPSGADPFWLRIKKSLEFGWDIVKTFVLGIIGLWPIWILIIIVIVIVRKIVKKRRARREEILKQS